jgi:hypothetical protein
MGSTFPQNAPPSIGETAKTSIFSLWRSRIPL